MSFAQGEISLSVENVDLKTLLVEIEKKSDIRFTYLNQLSDTNKDISLAVTNKTVEEILNLVLSKKGYGIHPNRQYDRYSNEEPTKPANSSN